MESGSEVNFKTSSKLRFFDRQPGSRLSPHFRFHFFLRRRNEELQQGFHPLL